MKNQFLWGLWLGDSIHWKSALLFVNRRQKSSIISDYISNCKITSDDISQSVLDERYVYHQINKMVGYISNIGGAYICDIGSEGGLSSALIKAGADSVVAVDITSEYFKQFELENQVKPLLANGENLPFGKV